MYIGKSSRGIEFYNLLNQSEEFTSELGKVALASGKLEAEMIQFLRRNGINRNFQKAKLGALIRIANENNLFTENEKTAFKAINKQRNYLTHNIYALFTDFFDETILEKENLLDSDVNLYVDRAWQLRDNLNELADVIRKKTVVK